MAKPVYALVGNDSFLQLQELANIAAALGKEAQRADFDGESASLADVLVTRFREQLEDYVAAPSDSGTLLLRLSSMPANQRIYKLIEKAGQVIKCEPPGEAGLIRWASEHAKNVHRVALAPEAAKL